MHFALCVLHPALGRLVFSMGPEFNPDADLLYSMYEVALYA